MIRGGRSTQVVRRWKGGRTGGLIALGRHPGGGPNGSHEFDGAGVMARPSGHRPGHLEAARAWRLETGFYERDSGLPRRVSSAIVRWQPRQSGTQSGPQGAAWPIWPPTRQPVNHWIY